jgi:hypothetical protein
VGWIDVHLLASVLVGRLRLWTTEAAERQEVTIAWRLFTPATPATPKLTGTSKAASGGGFGLGSALRLAASPGRCISP